MLVKKKFSVLLPLLLASLVAINWLSEKFYYRLDLTEDRQYTLSKATKDILKGLEEKIKVKAYFSEQLPPDFVRVKKSFEDMLIEYNRLSGGKIDYEFINPLKDEKTEQEAIQAGVQPVMINVREKDQMKQQKAYLGAVFELGDRSDAIPFIQPGAPLEYAMSTSIKKISTTDKPHIAFLQGHGEPPLYEMIQVNTALSVLYQVEHYTISETEEIPDRFKTLVIIAPKDSFRQEELQKIDAYLERGGNVLVAINRVSGDFKTLFGAEVNTGLESWLSSKGISVDNSFIIDSKCGMVALQQQQGMFSFTTNISFPYLPLISKFADHPAVKGIESVQLIFASPLTFTGSESQGVFTPLAFTSERSGNLKAPQFFNVQRQWTTFDFPLQKQVVAGVLEKNSSTGVTSKLLVIGDGDFAVNGPRERMQQLQPDNVNFLVNAIDWLTDKTGLIELRTKGIQFRPLKELEDSTKTLLKYLNFLLPMALVLGYGLIRAQVNRNRRIRRMEENYE